MPRRSSASGTSAATSPQGREPSRAGLRRVLRHPAHQQRGADDHRAGAEDARARRSSGRARAGSRRATSSPSTWRRAARSTARPATAASRSWSGRSRRKRPFFFYYPMTQIHFPTLAHPDFAGKTGAGDVGDAMAEMDANVGRVLDAIDRLGIARNTIVLWCTDNGPEQRRPWRGSPGPWSRLLQQRDGGRHPHAVHHPLAGADSGRSRHRTRSSTRSTSSRRWPRPPAPTSSRRIAPSTA